MGIVAIKLESSSAFGMLLLTISMEMMIFSGILSSAMLSSNAFKQDFLLKVHIPITICSNNSP
ncbi:MAG: hypothetical protein A3F42_07475 [Gammaproteobacteria bacterium RIFCSPHIGHO2_12_FULL_37_34]|nr:MAG: hypothetical protein A3F42_07475 [Gammaproteobacteria bacterium RIFCSPHIGHO2_12_FULL_37_34]